MATSRVMLTFSKFRCFPINVRRIAPLSTSSQLLNTTIYSPGYSRDPGELFFKEEVQNLLHRITGGDHEKIFRYRKLGTKLEAPHYELLTDEELEKVFSEMEEKAKRSLKMPPLLKERDNAIKVLSKNPELQGFDTAKYVFTDITPGVTDAKRVIVTRDPDGILREASWEEKQRVCQVYFPRHGRELFTPKMFEEQHLQPCLERGDYEFILDRACAQFEPDDPIYIRVTRKTYDHIDQKGQYASLRSTRHFGPMALHLVLSKRIDDLLFYFVSKEEVGPAADLVRLFHSVENGAHPNETEDHKLIQDYIKNHALKKPALELAWDTLLEIEKQRSEVSTGIVSKASN